MSLHPCLHMIYNMTSPVLRRDRKHDKTGEQGTQSLKSRNGEALPYRVTSVCWRVKVASPPPSGCRQIAARGFSGNQGLERHCHPRSALLHCLRQVGEDTVEVGLREGPVRLGDNCCLCEVTEKQSSLPRHQGIAQFGPLVRL